MADSFNLFEFESNGSQYLYNLDPATGNLFYLDSITLEGRENNPENNSANLTEFLRYRVKSVKLDNTIGLEFDNNKVLLPGNPICLTGIKESHNFTIDWVEDSFFRIQKFHKDWLSHWFENKVLKDGADGKFVTFVFKVFYLKNVGGLSPVLSAHDSYTLTLKNCVPTDLSDFSFSYDDQDNGKTFVGKYIAKEISISGGAEPENGDSVIKYN